MSSVPQPSAVASPPVDDRLQRVTAKMQDALASDEPRLQTLLNSLDDFHGKMLRPRLLLATADCFGEARDGI